MRCPNCKREVADPQAVLCQCGIHLPTWLARFLPLGTVLQGGRYRVEEILGQGGFGVTYLARHLRLKQPVAVKEFYPQDRVERDRTTGDVSVRAGGRDTHESAAEHYRRTLQRFLREGETLGSLNHPNVVRVRDLFEEKGTAYIVMDYVAPARTLDDLLAERPDRRLPEPEARELTGQLVSALEAVHREGICHLDIKPENVLVTPSGQAVLIDFGAARQSVSTRTTREYTEKYAPPEVLAKREIGPGSDIFELAMMAHELLTGEPPPSSLERLHPMFSGRREEAAWAPDGRVPAQWRAMLTEALRLSLDERPSSVREWWDRAWAAPRPKEAAPSVSAAVEAGRAAYREEKARVAREQASAKPAAAETICPNCGRRAVRPGFVMCPQCAEGLLMAGQTLPPGTRLAGGYEIEHALGVGAHYVTYQARHARSDINFVVKEYFPPDAAVRLSGNVSPKEMTKVEFGRRVDGFLQRARDFARLSHPGLVQVYDQFRERGTGYVAMDMVAGRTLREELDAQRGRHFSPTRVTEIMGHLVAAVAEAHRAGFYHFNLRPKNVILRADDGRPVLTEFYAAKWEGHEDKKVVEHTLRYYAPEVLAGDVIGLQTDVYGLGVLLHELLTGTLPPFALTRILDDTWEPVGLDTHWKNLVVSALRLPRQERPADVTEWWQRYGDVHAAPIKKRSAAAGPRPTTPPAAPPEKKPAESKVAPRPAPPAPADETPEEKRERAIAALRAELAGMISGPAEPAPAPAPAPPNYDATDRLIVLFGMAVPGAILGLGIGALASAALGFFKAATWGAAAGIAWRGALVWLACGALTGAVIGIHSSLFVNRKIVNLFLSLLSGTLVALAFDAYGQSYSPEFLWGWYEQSFGGHSQWSVMGVNLGEPLMTGLGSVLGLTLGGILTLD